MKRLAMSLVAAPVLLLLALLAPAGVAAAGPVAPSAACSAVGTVVTCDLWAKTGSITLPGTPAGETPTPIWGFAASSSDAAGVPGPVLIVNSGDSVTVTLHNQLAVTTAILFEGQPVPPDLAGVAAGSSNSATPYSFTAGAPGSYLYEAGLLPGTQYQAAMGLYGALIVRPVGGLMQANNNTNTAFTDEAVVVLGEIDPKLNGSANPASFDLRGFAPRYFLINGKPYPQTDAITTGSGDQLLIRYLNAGIQHHSMGVLGLRQTVVNDDGTALAFPRHMTAETLAPGQATDNLISIPATTAVTTKYVVYNAALALNNTTLSGTGGMLTTIVATGAGTTGDTAGPVTSGLTIDIDTGAIAASVSDVSTGGSDVANAEYFIDTLVAPGGGLALGGTFGSPTVSVSGDASALLADGDHTIYVRGHDSAGNWGPITSAVFSIDRVGPATTGVVLTPGAVNTTTATVLTATADDRATGGGNITDAQFFIDGGLAIPMTLSTTSAPVSSLSATIPAGLSVGVHTIDIQSKDALNWGLMTSVNLTVSNQGPETSLLQVAPDNNNGTQGINSTNPSVRVSATFHATAGTVSTGEIFIDTLGADATGIPMPPTDGNFDSADELSYVDVPLTTINQLGGGDHPIYVHGKDSVGNWGAAGFVVLHINKPGPATSGVALTPAISSTVAVSVSASATTVGINTRNVTGGEYFIDALGLTGTGTPMTVAVAAKTAALHGSIPSATVAALAVGNHTIYVRAHDSANNWGSSASAILVIERTAPTFTGITLSPDTIIQGTVSTGLAVNGATDVGSGVGGGEFWIGTAPIAEGTGTSFNGTTTTVPTASLTPGTYQVNVRIQDLAGNWSVGTHVATLTVNAGTPPPDTTAPTFTSLTLTPNLIVYTTPSVGLTVNGASDIGTGVVGGEFWIDTASITPGTGTQFSGTSATVPTASLLPGTHNVRVRIKDAATPTANWSTVQSAVLTVSPPVAIFSDGFEYANLPGTWSSRSTTSTTRLNTSTLARQVGARGLRAQGNNTNYVQYNFGSVTNPVTGVFDARFSFRPNAKTTSGQDIFTASSNTTYGVNRAFRVRYRRVTIGGVPQAQVQIQVGTTNSAAAVWRTISGGTAFHKIEVVWQAVGGGGPNPGRLELLVDGAHWQTLVTTSTRTVGSFRLGAVSVGSGSSTYEYFDNFAAKRTATPYLP